MALVTMPHSLRKAEILRYEKGGGAHGFHSSRNFNQQSFRFLPHTAGARCQGRTLRPEQGTPVCPHGGHGAGHCHLFWLVCSIVASQARITQLSGEIDDAKSELTNAQSYNDYLSTTMDQITNSTSVQQEAEDRLGLVKMDPSQVTYVRLEDESVIERAAGTADKFFAGIKTAALSLLGSFDP